MPLTDVCPDVGVGVLAVGLWMLIGVLFPAGVCVAVGSEAGPQATAMSAPPAKAPAAKLNHFVFISPPYGYTTLFKQSVYYGNL
jgi:hypothetical protein